MGKVALVAALEREVHPLVKLWRSTEREHEGKRFRFFEDERVVLVCGGIGAEAARRAAEAVIAIYQPESIKSVGFAGALDPALHVGNILSPAQVIDARDGSRAEIDGGKRILLTIQSVAGVEQKRKLAKAYQAQAVDMEAAAVAQAARLHHLPFAAVKVISDEFDFALLSVNRFVAPDGRFRSANFVAYVAIRPWLWAGTAQLAKNSTKAAQALCRWLALNHHSDDESGVLSLAAQREHHA
jgi:adenosylhomocysteine nucleosidase